MNPLLSSLLSLFWCVAAIAGPVDQGPGGITLEALLQQQRPDFSDSLDSISASLRGTPYVLGNAGEGIVDVFDQDPLWRLDVQDCTTYLETVMAAAMARDRASFERTLWKIRYMNGVVSFNTRNHFPEVDWIPNNERAGFVRDLTAQLFPDLKRSTSVVIDKPFWYSHMSADSIEPKSRDLEERERLAEILRSYSNRYERERATLDYLPMQSFFVKDENGELQPNKRVLSKIPNATAFNIVRENWAPGGQAMAVSHQGFVIQKPDGTYMRHASPGRGVVEDRLDIYFKKFLDSPTIRGINLLEILELRESDSLL